MGGELEGMRCAASALTCSLKDNVVELRNLNS